MIFADAGGAGVHGEFSSADAHAPGTEAAARFTLYQAGGTSTLTLGTLDIVFITDISVSSAGTTNTVTIFDGSNTTVDGGEMIWRGIVPTNSVVFATLQTPHMCQKGSTNGYPKVLTSVTGQIDVVFHGFIVTANT